MKRWILAVLRIAIVGAILWYLFRGGVSSVLDFREVGKAAGRAGPILLALCLQGIAISLCAFRFQFLLRGQAILLSTWNAFELTFVGSFFNAVSPGTTGGDVAKAFYLVRAGAKGTEGVTVILLDRVVGLAGLTFLASGMFAGLTLFAPGLVPAPIRVLGPFFAAFAAGIVAFFLLAMSGRTQRFFPIRPLFARLPFSRFTLRVVDAVYAYRGARGMLLLALLLSLGVHVLSLTSMYCLAQALGGIEPLSWPLFLVLAGVGLFLNAMPIMPGGLGWGESAFDREFALVHWPHGAELAALLHLCSYLWWLVPGGLFYLLGKRRFAYETREAGPAAASPVGPADAAPR